MIINCQSRYLEYPETLTSILKRCTFKQPSSKILLIAGALNGRSTMAVADTGSDYNIISASFARQNGIKTGISGTGTEQLLQLASGAYISPAGNVTLPWVFKDETKETQLMFYILEGCRNKIIIGNNTLLSTATMTFNSHRLSYATIPESRVFDVNYISDGKQVLQGTLNNHKVYAVPDTGSHRNILSVECAKRLKLRICQTESARVCLRFPDGSTRRTIGTIVALWRFSNRHRAFRILWDILPGFPQEALLGVSFLCRREVYKKYPESFTVKPRVQMMADFYLIVEDSSKDTKNNEERQLLPRVRNDKLRKQLRMLSSSVSKSQN